MKYIIIDLIAILISISTGLAAPGDWGVQTWTNIDTRYPIYRKDIVYGTTPFLIDGWYPGSRGL